MPNEFPTDLLLAFNFNKVVDPYEDDEDELEDEEEEDEDDEPVFDRADPLKEVKLPSLYEDEEDVPDYDDLFAEAPKKGRSKNRE